jgi:hypothetical protein
VLEDGELAEPVSVSSRIVKPSLPAIAATRRSLPLRSGRYDMAARTFKIDAWLTRPDTTDETS